MVEIFTEDLRWKGKLLVFTWHFKEEFDKLKKPIEFILDVLDKGEHILMSKTLRTMSKIIDFRAHSKMQHF